MERLLSARGPHSMRPWNQPTTSRPEIASSVIRHSDPGFHRRQGLSESVLAHGLSCRQAVPHMHRRTVGTASSAAADIKTAIDAGEPVEAHAGGRCDIDHRLTKPKHQTAKPGKSQRDSP